MDKLSLPERTELQKHEATIERGMATFLDVGRALLAIRDGKLYRADYATFEAYAKGRWNMSRPQAYRLIDSVDVEKQLASLSPIGDKNCLSSQIPQTESVYRQLADVDEDTLPEVVAKAAELAGDKPITAAIVTEAKREIIPPAAPKQPDFSDLLDRTIAQAETTMRSIDALQVRKRSKWYAPALDGIKGVIEKLGQW